MNFYEKYQKQIIILSIIIIIPIIILIIYSIFKSDVITDNINGDSSLPQINISGNDADAINELLNDLYKKYTSDGKSKFNYKTETYKNIISLLITIDEYDEETDTYIKKFMSYNIDKSTKKYISNEDLTDKFGIDILEVNDKANQRLKVYYQDEVNLGYVEANECDYNCYLGYMRNINVVMDNVSLVVENSKLVAYINLNIDAFSDDENYFDSLNYDPYKIIINE